jgi:hypothetical protein
MSTPPSSAAKPIVGSGIVPTVQSYSTYLYWFLGLAVAIGIGYVLYKMNFQIAGVLVFLGTVVALFYYYVKWFQIPDKESVWPPTTTPCPDFLTLVNPGLNGASAICMDYVGVSSNGRLQKADPAKRDQISKPQYTFKIDRTKPNTDLCQSAAEYGLTWSSICPE